MAYVFELAFTGLFVLTFKGGDKEHPDEVEVALIKTAGHPHGHDHGENAPSEHRPLLSYLQETIGTGSTRADAVLPAPNGHLIAYRDLTDETIAIVPPEGGPSKITALWRPAPPEGVEPPQFPENEEQEVFLDWLPSLQKILPGAPAPRRGGSFELPAGQVAGRVRFTAGTLFAAEVVRKMNNSYVVWDFKQGNQFNPQASQAIADLVILRLEGLTRPVRIEGHTAGDLFLRPSRRPGRGHEGSLVQASVTNLPTADSPLSTTLDHFESLLQLLSSQGQTPVLAVPTATEGLLQCSSSTICPGVNGGGGGTG